MRFVVNISVLALLLSPMPVLGQGGNKGGRSGAQFLKIGVSGRAVGMAEAYVATANEVSAVYYNPSGLMRLEGPEVMFSNIQWPGDISYNFAAAALPVRFLEGAVGVFAAGLSTGEMIVRTPLRPDGTGEKFQAADYVAGVSFARDLTDHFAFGFTLKGVAQYAYKYSATGWAVDLSSMYYTGFRSFRFGWILSNFGPDMKFIDETFSLPTVLTFGMAVEAVQNEMHALTVSLQANRPNDNAERGSLGLEYRFENMLALRCGYKINYDLERYSFGVGLRLTVSTVGAVRFDYGYSDMRYLLRAHRLSVALSF